MGVWWVPSNAWQVRKGRAQVPPASPAAPVDPAPAPGGRRAAAILASVPRIYTRTGDDGSTGLLYGGRISKADPVAEATGAIDEAVAALGLARALAEDPSLQSEILDLQRELFVIGADLATNPAERERLEPGVSLATPEMAGRLEARIDELVLASPLPNAFIVPGANAVSAALDVSRSAVRRGERRVVAIREAGGVVNAELLLYLNRLSDLLFVLARIAAGEAEPLSREGGA
jgi:cob(I)alamin adenosyltransferase